MPRRREIPKREVLPDPLYNSQLVTKFVNVVMRDGKKSVAERSLYDALEAIRQRHQEEGRHPPHGGGEQGVRPLPLVDPAASRAHPFKQTQPVRASETDPTYPTAARSPTPEQLRPNFDR